MEDVFLDEYPAHIVGRLSDEVKVSFLPLFFNQFSGKEITDLKALYARRKHEISYHALMERVYVDSRYNFCRRFSSLSEFMKKFVEAKTSMKEEIEIEVIKRILYKEVPGIDAAKAAFLEEKRLGKAA
jgi:hypothetical protein